MKADTEIVTVAQAKEYLERVLPNRTLNERLARRYAEDMRTGRWINNGQGIVLDHQGNLIDGQHRCQAIVFAQQSISMLVVRGVPATAMETIDSGRPRGLADVLRIEGYSSNVVLAATARLVFDYAAGVALGYSPTKAALLELIKRHKEALTFGVKMVDKVRQHVFSRTQVAAVLVLATNNERLLMEAQLFFDGIAYGEGLYQGDARLTFRNWAMGLQRYSRVALPTFGAATRAWNAYAAGKELAAIRFPPSPTRHNMEVFGFDRRDWADVPNLVEETTARAPDGRFEARRASKGGA